MHVRPAHATDLADLATIARDAMYYDELTVVLAPHRHRHPECLRQGILRRLKKRFYDGHVVLAAVSDENDIWWDGVERVVGHLSASSTKQKKMDTETEKKPWLPFSWNELELRLLRLEDLFAWYTHADQSLSRKAWAQFVNGPHDTRPFANIKEYWHVDHVSVDPAYQRKGIGSAMIKWLQNIAAEDNLPIILVASHQGRPMYQKSGFVDRGPSVMGLGLVNEAMAWFPPAMSTSHSAGETEDGCP
ncbi:hypothetical protein AYL99_10825 [Fonsecaea erecta]|uniref:N-acetyltransferase domain-containing protein n=1 Tax=Fonsecaea erecta TaxID=1367422 RepID=A0A178Z7W0_9EURO|nr:hypothetical protein AYL99_10825 [Fonsecaea erecta]OAP55125.1 hypothetical protein AYL99_10825 [Fonsecaea erecta]